MGQCWNAGGEGGEEVAKARLIIQQEIFLLTIQDKSFAVSIHMMRTALFPLKVKAHDKIYYYIAKERRLTGV